LRAECDGISDYLIKFWKMSYAPSISSLMLLSSRPAESRKQKKLLAFACPEYRSSHGLTKSDGMPGRGKLRSPQVQATRLPLLRFSIQEVQRIAKYFSEPDRDIYVADRASEEAVKHIVLQDYQIIHFASHGLIDSQSPLRSALVLSGGGCKEEDGLLQAQEICNLKIDADLVVLSACGSATGCMDWSEGVIGLPRVFFIAGARSVLSTLWRVNDESTALFMDYFYKQLSLGVSKDEAVRQAKVKMLLSSYAHPFYWAAFILSGNRKAINFQSQ
jgi:CHAT domain-containing protein